MNQRKNFPQYMYTQKHELFSCFLVTLCLSLSINEEASQLHQIVHFDSYRYCLTYRDHPDTLGSLHNLVVMKEKIGNKYQHNPLFILEQHTQKLKILQE